MFYFEFSDNSNLLQYSILSELFELLDNSESFELFQSIQNYPTIADYLQ
jgi:hypothetical protein